MANPVSLTEKTGVVVFSRIVGTFVEIATVIVLVRMLSTTDFAIVSLLLLIYETARYLATLGFPESVFYFFERVSSGSRRGFAIQTCFIMLLTGILAGMGMLGFNLILPSYLSEWSSVNIDMTRSLLPVMAGIAILEVPTWPVNNILLASDRQKDASWYQLINGLLTFLAMLGPLLLGYELDTAIWSLFGYSVIRFIISFVWLGLILPERTEPIPAGLLREQIRFALPIGLSALVSRLNRYADKFIVSYFVAEEAFAIYNIGAQEVPVVRVIPFAVGSVLISRYVALYMARNFAELQALWRKGVEKVSLIVIPLTILFIVIAHEFIVVLFGAANASAALPFQIYTVIILTRVAHYGSVLQAYGDTKGIVRLSVNLLLTNIILTIPMTYQWGIIGAVSGTLLANLLNWRITLGVIGKHMDLPWFRALPFHAYLRNLAVSLFAGVTVFLVGLLLHTSSPFLSLMWKSTLFLLIFGATGSYLAVITQSDWRTLRDWLTLRFLYRKSS